MGQTHALNVISRAKGWSPDHITEADGTTPAKYPALPDGGQGLANFDVAADAIRGRYVGRLPQAIPAGQADFPGDHPAINPEGDVPWNHANPDPNRPLGVIKPPAIKRGRS